MRSRNWNTRWAEALASLYSHATCPDPAWAAAAKDDGLDVAVAGGDSMTTVEGL
jgi:hypothetical protein